MADFSDEAFRDITDYIEVQGREWAKQYFAGRIAYFGKRNLRARGDLIQSLQYEVTSTLQQAAETRISIAFKDYGRYVDMRTLRAAKGGGDYVKALEMWIEQRGLLERFTRKFLATKGLKTLPANAANQMAWGIVKKRHSNYRRRLAWYSKSRTGALNDLYNKVAANIPRLVGQEIKKAFK